MHILLDKNGKTSGYLYNNVILLPGNIVSGVVLAHCVFTRRGTVKGKFFGGTLYNQDREIVAKESTGDTPDVTVDQAKLIMVEAWKVLSLTTDHICPWVEAGENWSKTSLKEFLEL